MRQINTEHFQLPRRTVITLGKFDGLHLGHRKLIHTLQSCKTEELDSVVFTFSVPPASIVQGTRSGQLMTGAERTAALEQAGIREGDVITAIGDTKIATGKELNQYFDRSPVTAAPLTVTFLHHGVEKTTVVYPQAQKAYRLGFSYNLENEKTEEISSRLVSEISGQIEQCLTRMAEVVEIPLG